MNTNIYNLNEQDKICGEIYKITNIINNKIYIGQTKSHYKNKNKYRPFGFNSRFKSHISEALNNTKLNQCIYLNNAIRKYGEKNFKVELIESCSYIETDIREIYYISHFNSIYPNGYNMTKGGKNFKKNNINLDINNVLNKPKKRGKEFGYKHSENTKLIISERITDYWKNPENIDKLNEKINKIKKHAGLKKIKALSKYKLCEPLTQYIKSTIDKNGNIIDHKIIINNNKFKLKMNDLNDKYNKLLEYLKIVFEKSKNQEDTTMDNPQPFLNF